MAFKHSKRLGEQDQKSLAIWASDCAEHVLIHFEKMHPEDERPRKAIEAARAWVRGDLPMVEARKAAFATHAARDAKTAAAQAAARSAGHAAATAHVADYARHAAVYAIKVAQITGNAATAEGNWQYQRLPEHLRSTLFSASDKP